MNMFASRLRLQSQNIGKTISNLKIIHIDYVMIQYLSFSSLANFSTNTV